MGDKEIQLFLAKTHFFLFNCNAIQHSRQQSQIFHLAFAVSCVRNVYKNNTENDSHAAINYLDVRKTLMLHSPKNIKAEFKSFTKDEHSSPIITTFANKKDSPLIKCLLEVVFKGVQRARLVKCEPALFLLRAQRRMIAAFRVQDREREAAM